MIKSLCRHPGCSALIDRPGYCDNHKKNNIGWNHKKTTTERGYGHAWRKLRVRVLSRDKHLCQVCLRSNKITPASEVDHIISKANGGSDDESNLQSICNLCHKIKTGSGK